MSDSTRWVTAAALQALAAQGLRAGAEFTAGELECWTRSTLTRQQRVHASSKLCALAFVRHRLERTGGGLIPVDTYRITAEGAAAIQAAAQGQVRKSGPKGSRAPNPTDPDALASRLWRLLRMRRALDSDTAAQLLCDAASGDFERVQATVRRTLARWATTPQVQVAARRVAVPGQARSSNGCKRYVLVHDTPEPPRWRQAGKAAQVAA
jgi:hypothetical protein